MNKYEKLLKKWCDRLITLQITEIKAPLFYGGILCPSCAMIHGRIGDAVYPFTVMYSISGDEKYLTAAKRVIDWSEYNLKRDDGGYYNDKCSGWKGISVFSATALGETLLNYSHLLEEETRLKWLEIFRRLAEFVYDFFDNKNKRTNVNYYATICPVMALGYRLLGDEKFKIKGYTRFNWVKSQFTAEGLLFGEGPDKKTPKNCRYVDLGYNVEESLPALATFAHIMEDNDALAFIKEKFRCHLEFMLPDGGWDNSFGTRSNKWTYWGSRTSDGAQTGLCYFDEPIFKEAVEQNFKILEICTKDGLLYGGPHYAEFGEEPCSHHTFCHAKAVAKMVETGFKYEEKAILPREAVYGVKAFESIHTTLISKGQLRATFTDNDAVDYYKLALTGGTLSLLWTEKHGMLLSSAPSSFDSAFTEPRNMQLSRKADQIANPTLRLEKDGFSSQNDTFATVSVCEEKALIKVCTTGTLRNISQIGDAKFSLDYTFRENSLKITASCETEASLIIPIISTYEDSITVKDTEIKIAKPTGDVTITADTKHLNIPHSLNHRDISLIGGFMTFPLSANIMPDIPFEIEITV